MVRTCYQPNSNHDGNITCVATKFANVKYHRWTLPNIMTWSTGILCPDRTTLYDLFDWQRIEGHDPGTNFTKCPYLSLPLSHRRCKDAWSYSYLCVKTAAHKRHIYEAFTSDQHTVKWICRLFKQHCYEANTESSSCGQCGLPGWCFWNE